jgi:hypothetical protein
VYEYHDGNEKGDTKPKRECKYQGPWWASFNEPACDVYNGIFCPNPRPCKVLKECVEEQLLKTEDKSLYSLAYHEYLKDAPKVKKEESSKQCGALREYLGYDHDFPDDQHICDEFPHIQCREDFSNLDETIANSSGGAGSGGADIMRKSLMKKEKCES